MKSTMSTGIAGVLVVLLAGCAANPQDAKREYTHEWVAGNRAAERQFTENNASCTSAAGSVSGYEQCMTEKGYRRSAH